MIRIKRIFFLLVLLLTETVAGSQNFVYDWVRNAGGERWDLANDIVIDNEKNVYMTGGFEHTAFFGIDSVISKGDRDIFIAKYDSIGTLVWLKSAGGKKYDNVTDIKIDSENNLLLTGNFQDTVYFEEQELTTDVYMNNFIAKYSEDGYLLEIKKIDAELKAEKLFITPEDNNDFLLSGTYYNQMNIDNDTIQSTGETNIFIARFGNDLTNKSLVNIGGFADISLKDIKYFEHELYLLCEFTDSIDINENRYWSYGNSDILILKIDTIGNVKNIKHLAGMGKDEASSLIIGKDSSIYISSEFESVLYLDKDSLISKGGKDLLLMKTDKDFNMLWYRQIGGCEDEYANALLINAFDALYLTGSFSDSLTTGNNIIFSEDMTADIFLAKFTLDGNNVGLSKVGGSGNEYQDLIINDSDNYLYIIGNFDCDFVFGISDSVFSENKEDVFIARFYDCDYAHYPDIGNDTSFCGYGSLRILNDTVNFGNFSEYYENYIWNTGEIEKYIRVSDSGYYYVTTTDNHKCKLISDSVFVAVFPVPEPDLGDDIYTETNEEIELFGGLFETYLWSNGTVNERCFINPDTLGKITNIFLEVTDINSCKGRDSITIFKSPDSNIDDILITSSVYPNPNNGHFYVNLNNIKEKIKTLKIYTVEGRKVYEQNNITSDNFEININSKGTHYLVLESRNRLFFEKIIIQ